MSTYRYQCLRFQQTESGTYLVQFAAHATDIDLWAGVPQKRTFEYGTHAAGETVGFQRTENAKRVKNLVDFYNDPDNVIQNPLLCALRKAPNSTVHFTRAPDTQAMHGVETGELLIQIPDFGQLSLLSCFRYVRQSIEERVPILKETQLDRIKVMRLKRIANEEPVPIDADPSSNHSTDSDQESASSEPDNPTGALFEESHITDFWEELYIRETVLQDLPEENRPKVTFLGYSKDTLLSYLRPVVLVDGQHRLRGALEAARSSLNDKDTRKEIQRLIKSNKPADQVEQEILRKKSRLLPISLLMSSGPEDQVFQFVVVNQKATPVGTALLGTIVSTTLSNSEMENVVQRLERAGIEVEDARVITYLSKHPDSPFAGLVDRGLASSAANFLQWNVFASLIKLFRYLKNGKLFGQKNDYANIWRKKYLPKSKIVADYAGQKYKSPFEYWSAPDGPWRDVFIKFWTIIRDKFGSTEDADKHNYWGSPRTSNLFNKISLTILAADFFMFLRERAQKLNSVDAIEELVDDWLEDVKLGYFDKDWDLSGVKKDSVGIRNQWAQLWADYRKRGGTLPKKSLFRKPLRPD